jgi:hypothetical protein
MPGSTNGVVLAGKGDSGYRHWLFRCGRVGFSDEFDLNNQDAESFFLGNTDPEHQERVVKFNGLMAWAGRSPGEISDGYR